MDWLKNRKVQQFAAIGFLGGILLLISGLWLALNRNQLSLTLWSFSYIHRINPMLFILDLTPIILAIMAGLLGMQSSLSATIARGKKEWETIFDSFSDLIFVTNSDGLVIRCNRAVIHRLNTRYIDVIGKPISEILSGSEQDGVAAFNDPAKGFSWSGRIYDVSTVAIEMKGAERQSLFILRDITLRKQAEAAQEESETLFRGLFDLSPDAIVVIDPHAPDTSWPIIDCNKVACFMNGYQREELIGQSIDILNLTAGTPDERMAYLNGLRTANNMEIETQHRRKNGEIFQVAVSTSLIWIGERELIIGIDRDITERKKVEEELAKQQYLLNAMLDTIPDYIYFKDIESRFIRTSKAHATAFGLSDSADVIGKTDFDFFTEEHARPAYDDEQEIIRSGQPFVKEERETWSDRPDTWVMTSKMPLRNQQGEIIGTFGITRDITERKRVETELLREKQFLEAVILNSPAAIVVLDNQGNIVSCNPAFEQLYGYTSAEAVGENLDSLITTRETIDQASAYTQQALTSSVHGFGKRRRKDGHFASVEIFGVPIIVGEEKTSSLVIYHDITELDRTRREAEEANRAKSEFLANMSHELRTPMNGVMGMLELALDTTLTSEQRDYLQTSLQSAEALLTLLNDILDFSKIEAGKLEFDSINFSLRNAVEDVAYTLAKRAQDKGLEMACLIHPDLSSEFRGDPGRLRQILVNL
ncbi:MAG: PAS domain S-box protein, partial [Anaerolineales bacterium]